MDSFGSASAGGCDFVFSCVVAAGDDGCKSFWSRFDVERCLRASLVEALLPENMWWLSISAGNDDPGDILSEFDN